MSIYVYPELCYKMYFFLQGLGQKVEDRGLANPPGAFRLYFAFP